MMTTMMMAMKAVVKEEKMNDGDHAQQSRDVTISVAVQKGRAKKRDTGWRRATGVPKHSDK